MRSPVLIKGNFPGYKWLTLPHRKNYFAGTALAKYFCGDEFIKETDNTNDAL